MSLSWRSSPNLHPRIVLLSVNIDRGMPSFGLSVILIWNVNFLVMMDECKDLFGFQLTAGEVSCLSETCCPNYEPCIMVGYPRVGSPAFLVLAMSGRSPWVELVVG